MHSSPAAVFLSQGGQKGKILADAKIRTYRRLRRALAPIHDRCDYLFIRCRTRRRRIYILALQPSCSTSLFPRKPCPCRWQLSPNKELFMGYFLRQSWNRWQRVCGPCRWRSAVAFLSDTRRINQHQWFSKNRIFRSLASSSKMRTRIPLWNTKWPLEILGHIGEICVLSRIAIILEYQSVRIILVGKEFVIILLTPTFTWQQTCLRECKYWMTNSSFILEHSYNNLK